MKITDFEKKKRPVKAVQFGGVFLRGFYDWMLAKATPASRFPYRRSASLLPRARMESY